MVSDVQEDIFSMTPPTPPSLSCSLQYLLVVVVWSCYCTRVSPHLSSRGSVCSAVAAQQRHGREKAMCVCCVADGGWCWCCWCRHPDLNKSFLNLIRLESDILRCCQWNKVNRKCCLKMSKNISAVGQTFAKDEQIFN